ncbi:MAG: hypothetical protein ACYCQI_16785 [Gammaproteobacteria bacterium]
MTHRKELKTTDKKKPSIHDTRQHNLNRVLKEYTLYFPRGPLQLIQAMQTDEIWRFFIDGVEQQEKLNWLDYEKREEGYLRAIYSAFERVIIAIKNDEQLSSHLIKELHKLAVSKVKNTNYMDFNQNGFEFDNFYKVGFELNRDIHPNVSEQGLQELLLAMLEGREFLQLDLYKQGRTINTEFLRNNRYSKDTIPALAHEIFSQCWRDEQENSLVRLVSTLESTSEEDHRTALNKCVDILITNYHKEIKEAKHPLDKLKVITYLIRELEQLHPYLDGNCRTFCMLLLNFLLMKNHFQPAILKDPNRFDGLGINELMDDIITGMNNTLNLITYKKLFGIKTKGFFRNKEAKICLDSVTQKSKIISIICDDQQSAAKIMTRLKSRKEFEYKAQEKLQEIQDKPDCEKKIEINDESIDALPTQRASRGLKRKFSQL